MSTRKPSAGNHCAPRPQRMRGGSVRIIGGEWRRRRIVFPEAAQLRPTPDRVRETLFNWLGQRLTGLSCLDLFAGSGALGLEAASRGAARVTLVEKHRSVVVALRESVRMLGANQVSVVHADALEFLCGDRSTYDVAFIDPPFSDGPPSGVMGPLSRRLAAGARVYVESDREFEPPPGLRTIRHERAGMVHFHLLQVG